MFTIRSKKDLELAYTYVKLLSEEARNPKAAQTVIEIKSEVVRFLEEHPTLRYTENSMDKFDYYDEAEDIEEEENEEYEW